MPRVVKSREEFEGEIYESLVLVEGRDLPLLSGERTQIGHERRRIDGVQRVTGRARYTQDVYLPGMLFVRVLRSPYPPARVRKIDTKKAEALPGVRGVLHRFNARGPCPRRSRLRAASACRRPRGGDRRRRTAARERRQRRRVGHAQAGRRAEGDPRGRRRRRRDIPHVDADPQFARDARRGRGVGRRRSHRLGVDPTHLRGASGPAPRGQAAALEDPRSLRLHGRRLRLEGQRRKALDHRRALRDAARPAGALHPHTRRGEPRGRKPLGDAPAAQDRREGRADLRDRAHVLGERRAGEMGRQPDRADEHPL
ncbi:MAG: hypothetical protein E6I64_00100 [Chloroflexi bacterium]|nr:MAG: hypothetical protein E6I64_00100 [Chloroflexota bacterium]